MPLRFYMDEHIHDAITDGLRRRGIDALRAMDDGHDRTPDSIILDRALFLGRVVFTRDDDFLAEAHLRQNAGTPFAGVVYVHQDRLSVGGCVTELEDLALSTALDSVVNRVIFLPRRKRKS